MAKINNSDCTRGLAKNAGIQESRDKTPNELAEKIVPTFETNPALLRKCNIVRYALATNATATTIYGCPTSRDFYLCGASLSVIKDGTATSLSSSIQILPAGDSNYSRVLSIAGLTLTAQSETQAVDFSRPILIERGTNISVINSTNVGNVTSIGCIWGYYVEVNN